MPDLASALSSPFVLGHYWSFASIEARLGPLLFTGFTEINYTSSLEVADVYGTRPQKLGTTRGKQNAEATLGMYMVEWEKFRAALGARGIGYGETRFLLSVSYAEKFSPVKTDVLSGCRIVSTEYANSEGNEPSRVSLGLNVMRIVEGVTGRIDFPIGVGF